MNSIRGLLVWSNKTRCAVLCPDSCTYIEYVYIQDFKDEVPCCTLDTESSVFFELFCPKKDATE